MLFMCDYRHDRNVKARFPPRTHIKNISFNAQTQLYYEGNVACR